MSKSNINTNSNANSAKRIHVISRKDGWAVKKEGTSRASRIYESKGSAIKSARALRQKGNDIVVHKRDGTIQKWEKAKK